MGILYICPKTNLTENEQIIVFKNLLEKYPRHFEIHRNLSDTELVGEISLYLLIDDANWRTELWFEEVLLEHLKEDLKASEVKTLFFDDYDDEDKPEVKYWK